MTDIARKGPGRQIGVFHPGTQHSWQTALALQQLDRLAWFATSLFYRPDRWPFVLERIPGPVGRRLAREFARIAKPGIDPDKVQTVGAIEWLQRIANRAGLRQTARQIDAWGNRTFVRHMERFIREGEDVALWGYSGSSRTSFELARSLGRKCILDRTNGDFRAYNAAMDMLAEDYPEWFVPVERRIPDAAIESDDREYELADHILVGCDYAARTIRDHARTPDVAKKVRVLDYCFDADHFADCPVPRPVDRSRPVRFLFLGLVIPRKGIHHILEAIERIPASQAELTIVGDMKIPRATFARFEDRVTYRPTVPRSEVPAIMAAHDVLLLPSYHEGAGIVLYEALAAGMGLIQSDRCAMVATPDTGLVLGQLGTDEIEAAMRVPIDDRGRLDHWRAHAQAEARNYTFARYRDNIGRFLAEAGI